MLHFKKITVNNYYLLNCHQFWINWAIKLCLKLHGFEIRTFPKITRISEHPVVQGVGLQNFENTSCLASCYSVTKVFCYKKMQFEWKHIGCNFSQNFCGAQNIIPLSRKQNTAMCSFIFYDTLARTFVRNNMRVYYVKSQQTTCNLKDSTPEVWRVPNETASWVILDMCNVYT